MNKKIRFLILILIMISSLVAACTPSEKQIRRQLDSTNYCTTKEDCTNIGPACPFGCYVYVNKKEEAKARNLIESYESKCAYGCLTCLGVECIDHKCQQIC